jgi:hypothetical protein
MVAWWIYIPKEIDFLNYYLFNYLLLGPMNIIWITRFIILFFYASGAYLFITAPIYRLYDKNTYNVYYIEISSVLLFTISNTLLLIIFAYNTCFSPKDNIVKNFMINLSIRLLFLMGSSFFMIASIVRLHDSKTLINVFIDMLASLYFSIGCPLDLSLYIRKDKHNKSFNLLLYGYGTRILYILGALAFLIACLYRVYDYITESTIYLDIFGTVCFLISNNMLFIRFLYKSLYH